MKRTKRLIAGTARWFAVGLLGLGVLASYMRVVRWAIDNHHWITGLCIAFLPFVLGAAFIQALTDEDSQ